MLRILTAGKTAISFYPPGEGFFTELRNKTMNKLTPQNEQQEHMVQILLAKMQGIEVEVRDVVGDWSTVVSDAVYINATYRIKSHKLPITKEMWAMIDKKWRWAAMDKGGERFFFEDEPDIYGTYWECDEGDMTEEKLLNINTDSINWRQSLTKRPEGV